MDLGAQSESELLSLLLELELELEEKPFTLTFGSLCFLAFSLTGPNSSCIGKTWSWSWHDSISVQGANMQEL